MNPLDRYEPLVDDVDAFRAACDRPLPSVVRTNGIAATPARVREAFDEAGVAYEPVDWHDGLFRLPDGNPGGNWPYVHGWTHGQEEVSVLPGLALDPQPGERVWDACAAPGSKTTQIADAMDDEGTVVANDNNLGRLSALRHNAERLGITNTIVTNQDARNFSTKPLAFDEFDRALVDAPCSCEGTCRKNPDVLDQWTLDHVHAVAGIQKGVLARAVQATRRGGVVVYSTCTFAPEENEAVLDHVLASEDCELVDFDLPLDTDPGVTEWDGETYDESVTRAKRIYPHRNDTGGFFCAKLRVGGTDDESGDAADGGEVAA
ncbi:RsmB/NOP family class I SAM-dependent RNA methyltransferase [Halorubrum sp. Atlit-8R]|uniref:RsmB/NOP family class I SAM-dependent RNA methyltransferase n=1 Tax=unclassified Halorubrum TaxID=2642239 RepID=UPI000EF21F9F|nr:MULTISPECIES: RsmB/NOP family class I SAM-dependent RNA methyltransferase [unclassified Halorubrum]RLM63441.1 RsmB/NOP family class I SAM-dependent RNA methyltransferase [Halorubrum sp. Atlit-9R]RLM76918.1 RsmB/NOP family class I SAM-dependent RNA methyltransferase [Halorubrum sp. Atlit-8R]